jgi:formiminoglutamase
VRRNGGRVGAAEAPAAIRHWLYRLTPWDGESDTELSEGPPLDLGDVRVAGDLEATQEVRAEVVAGVLTAGAVPVVLGGEHETAYGVYLGYVAAGRPVGLVNVDAHLDVRPLVDGRGHSGSPFRQALEHPTHPLPGARYVCLGAQAQATSRQHVTYVRERGGVVRWCGELRPSLGHHLARERDRLAAGGCAVHVSVDAGAVRAADVPGMSAPNPAGLPGPEVLAAARLAGGSPGVSGLDLGEVNPRHDRDGQGARWAALLVWNFLVGLRSGTPPAGPGERPGGRGEVR